MCPNSRLKMHYLFYNTSTVTTSSMLNSIQRVIYSKPMSQRGALLSVNLVTERCNSKAKNVSLKVCKTPTTTVTQTLWLFGLVITTIETGALSCAVQNFH